MTVPPAATTDPISDKPPRPRRWIPLSLRIFASILGVFGTASVLWFMSVWLPYHREQQIVHEIEGWGGSVYTVTDGPDWLRWLVGEDTMQKCKVFDRVHGVTLSSPAGPNAEWAQLKKISNHRHLYLHVRETADGVLVDTNGFTILDWAIVTMSLKGTTVTDEGLAQLSHLTNLKYLWLDGTAVTDLGLVHLSGLAKLNILFLGDTTVTHEGIKKLKKALPDCEISR